MSASGTFKFQNIDALPMTATITMPVKDWKSLKEELDSSDFSRTDSGWTFVNRILSDLLAKASKEHWANAEDEK